MEELDHMTDSSGSPVHERAIDGTQDHWNGLFGQPFIYACSSLKAAAYLVHTQHVYIRMCNFVGPFLFFLLYVKAAASSDTRNRQRPGRS